MNAAIQTWNQERDHGPGLPKSWPELSNNSFPGVQGANTIDVTYNEGQSKAPQACKDGTLRYPAAETQAAEIGGQVLTRIVVHSRYRECDSPNFISTFGPGSLFSDATNLETMASHELGHLMGLDHDNCSNGLMYSNGGRLFDGQPKVIEDAHCELADFLNIPGAGNCQNPNSLVQLGTVAGDDPDCPPLGGPMDRLRQICDYLPRLCTPGGSGGGGSSEPWWATSETAPSLECVTEVVTTWDGTTLTASTRTHCSYALRPTSLGSVVPAVTEGPSLRAAIGSSAGGSLEVSGDALQEVFGNQDLAFWIDQDPASVLSLNQDLFSPDSCDNSTDPNCPFVGFSAQISTAGLGPGEHTLQIVAADARDLYPGPGLLELKFVVPSTCGDTTPPSAQITAPTDGSAVSGSVPITVNASDNSAVNRVELWLDGSEIAHDLFPPHAFTWDSTTVSDGEHILQARAVDGCGNARFSPAVVVNVLNPAQPDIALFRDFDSLPLPGGGALDLGSTQPGVATSVRLRIENQGNLPLTLSNPASLVSGACFHQVETPPSSVLQPGELAFFRVRLLCGQGGHKTGWITVFTDDPDESPYEIALSGDVSASNAPDIAVYRDASNELLPSGSSTAMPSTLPGQPTSLRFRIENTGDADLVIENPTAYVSGTCFHELEDPTAVVAPNEATWLRVRLFCHTPGTYAGTLSLASNDPDEDPYVVQLSGEVIDPTAPEIAVYRDIDNELIPVGGSTAIPSTTAGTPRSLLFRIENTGDGDLQIGNPTSYVTGTCFHELLTPHPVVPAGSVAYFRVRLFCHTAGSYVGTVSLDNNDPDEDPYTFTVTGIVDP